MTSTNLPPTAQGTDHLHILLDALGDLESSIRQGHRPWCDYAGSRDDPKLSKSGYCALLSSAIGRITNALNEGRDQVDFGIDDEDEG